MINQYRYTNSLRTTPPPKGEGYGSSLRAFHIKSTGLKAGDKLLKR